MELKEKIMANIDMFAISDFCTEGGWPNFDNLEVFLFNEKDKKDPNIFDVEMVYECTFAGCCFIPGGDKYTRLRKKIKITETSFEVLS